MVRRMNTIDITVRADPATLKETAATALSAHKFRLTWDTDWHATAERGNKIVYAIAGAFAMYLKVGVRIGPGANPGESVLRLEKQSKGVGGGVWGVRKAKKNMEALRDGVAEFFRSRGDLVGVAES